MDWWLILIIMFGGMLFLMLSLGLPVAFSIGIMGAIGTVLWWGGVGNLSMWAVTAFRSVADFLMGPIPMFILMAEVIVVTGISSKAFQAVERLAGGMRGSLAHTTVITTTIFGAVTGFSPASCAAIGSIAIPEMMKRKYDKRLAVGVVGGGAALAILIPPSVLMVLYGSLADVSIGQLFIAGIIPGIISMLLFLAWVGFQGLVNPTALPRGKAAANLRDRLGGSLHLIPVSILIFAVLGTIYLGICTPTESAAIGAFTAFILALAYKVLTWPMLRNVILRTVQINSMLFAIYFSAKFFTQVLAYVQVPAILGRLVVSFPVAPWVIIVLMMALVIIMGCFMDPASILCVTIPIFIPVIKSLGFDPLWFGILFMINCELATLTPPVGMNLFVLLSIVPKEITITDIIFGCLPFLLLHGLTMLIVALVPALATWLPSMMIK